MTRPNEQTKVKPLSRMAAALLPRERLLDRSISPFQFGIRPEFVEPGREQKEDRIPMNVALIENMGAYKILNLTSNGIRIKSRALATEKVSVGDRLWVGIPEDKIKIFKDNKRIF